MTALRVLLVTDSFPPGSGGSGWSTFELARQLSTRGHDVSVVQARPGTESGLVETSYEQIRVTEFRRRVPNVPLVRNMLKNERLWSTLESYLAERISRDRIDIVHAQHVMTTMPSVRAARREGVPVVATVRDYWPVCYWSDLILDATSPSLCPACTTSNMRACVPPRAGALGAAAWPVIPYMRANLRTKRRVLAEADAVIAVSHAIGRDLRARAPELAGSRIEIIPNPVDMTPLAPRLTAATSPYVLYVGKLATNKGVQFLLPALDAARTTLPLVVAGDGPLRASLEADARARGREVRWLGWIDRAVTLEWMRGAAMLAFPSYGPESLSRVLIEASALGLPIAAMDTGGTTDVVRPDETGLLSTTVEGFAADLARLAGDAALRTRLGAAAAGHVREHFDAPVVAARVDALYASLISDASGRCEAARR